MKECTSAELEAEAAGKDAAAMVAAVSDCTLVDPRGCINSLPGAAKSAQ